MSSAFFLFVPSVDEFSLSVRVPGKSLTAIALLHSAFEHPSLVDASNGKPLFKSALIVAPVNTLTNWEDQIAKWTGNLETPLLVENLANYDKYGRTNCIKRWGRHGGVALMSEQVFHRLVQDDSVKQVLQPDILVLDEAHTMLKNSNNKVFKALTGVATKRRILLTGKWKGKPTVG